MAVGEMITSARLCTFEVTREYFTAITDKDHEVDKWEDTLCYQLGQLDGVRDVDYDGHFGEFIYFTIDDIEDCERLRNEIRIMIHNYARGAE